jgi:hypothetical protein
MTRSEYRQALAIYYRTLHRLRGTLVPIPENVTESAFDALDAADESTRRQVDRIADRNHR